ncbi:MAG: hypothetical protein ACK4HQ_09325 [Brevinematales bacterium]
MFQELKQTLSSQFLAAIKMLENAIDLCARGMSLYAELSERLSRLERKVYEVKNLKALAEGKETSPEMELFPSSETETEGEESVF